MWWGSQLPRATAWLLGRKDKVSPWALPESAKCHGIQMHQPYDVSPNTLWQWVLSSHSKTQRWWWEVQLVIWKTCFKRQGEPLPAFTNFVLLAILTVVLEVIFLLSTLWQWLATSLHLSSAPFTWCYLQTLIHTSHSSYISVPFHILALILSLLPSEL